MSQCLLVEKEQLVKEMQKRVSINTTYPLREGSRAAAVSLKT